MPYTYLEDVAIADAAFEARGKDAPALFTAAAEATMNLMVDRLDAIDNKIQRRIRLVDTDMDMLLFQFLNELIYYKDAEDLLLRAAHVQISESAEGWQLTAEGRGEQRDPSRHRLNVDVKAVTLHRFRVEKVGEGWHATVVLDI